MDITDVGRPKYHLQVISGSFQLTMPFNTNDNIDDVAKMFSEDIKNGSIILEDKEHTRFVFGPNTIIIILTTEQFEKMKRMSDIARPFVGMPQIKQ